MKSRQLAGSLAVAAAAIATFGATLGPALALLAGRTNLHTADVDRLAAALAGAALCAVSGWLCLGLLAGLLSWLPGGLGHCARRAHALLVPALLRRMIAGGAGVGVFLAPAAALASPLASPVGAHGPGQPAGTSSVTVPPPIWPTSDQPPAAHAPNTAVGTRHAVEAGESLWLIASHRLGAHATDAQVSAYWPQLYRANHGVIGADPDLIRPGQALRLPDPATLPATPTLPEPAHPTRSAEENPR